MSASVLFHVQHLLGIGHLRRAFLLVDAMEEAGLRVTLVTGGERVADLPTPKAARIVELAPIRAAGGDLGRLEGGDGNPVGEALRAARRAALLAAFAQARPDAVLIEAFPFGRRAFRFELDPLIAAARSARPRPRVLCSLRDILVMRDDPVRHREVVERVRRDFDAVLVHGDPEFIPLGASFRAADAIADRLVYTGYVAAPAGEAAARPVPEGDVAEGDAAEMLVSAGGGAVGAGLLTAALAARRAGSLAAHPWRLLAGPNLPEAAFAALASDLPARVVLERYRADFALLLRRCHVSVSQAGYNTVLDILGARARAVLVPFAAANETEQSLRARSLAARGLVEIVEEEALSPESLAQAIARAAARAPAAIALATDGARRSAGIIGAMIRATR